MGVGVVVGKAVAMAAAVAMGDRDQGKPFFRLDAEERARESTARRAGRICLLIRQFELVHTHHFGHDADDWKVSLSIDSLAF